jgi:CRISPR-associated endonuclease Cas2
MSAYIAAYDISHGSSRAKVARILLGCGFRIQKSVYQIHIQPNEVAELQRDIGRLLAKTDRFDILPLDRDTRRKRLCWQSTNIPPSVLML